MKNKYRIVSDSYGGYEGQVKYWWFPFMWFQLWDHVDETSTLYGFTNHYGSIEECKKFVESRRDGTFKKFRKIKKTVLEL